MTPDRLNSTGQIVMASERLENNLRSGNSYTRVFTGSIALIAAQRLIELAGGAAKVEVESTADGNYKLTSTYPWDVTHGSNAEPPVNVHEIETSMESVDIYLSDTMLFNLINAFGSLSGANGAKAFLKAAVSGYQTAIQNLGPSATGAQITACGTTAETTITATYAGAQQTLILNLFRGIAYHGQTSSRQFKSTYARRITAATSNQVFAAYVGVGQIWTSAEVAAFEGLPNNGFFHLASNYLWLKAGPRVKCGANQKTEVAYEYLSCIYAWSGDNTAYGSAQLLSF